MELKITSKEVLTLVKDRLSHLNECREFLDDYLIRRKLEEVIAAQQAKSKYEHERTRLRDSMITYRELCRSHALTAEIRGDRYTPTQAWLDDLEEMESAEQIVKYGLNDFMYGKYDKALDAPDGFFDTLRRLNKFDDSE